MTTTRPPLTRMLLVSLTIGWACLSLILTPEAVLAQRTRTEAPIDFVQAFDTLQKCVQANFYDKNLHGVNWREVRERYAPKVAQIKTKHAFTQMVNQMLDELKASHAELLTSDDFGYYLLRAVLSGDIDKPQVTHIGIVGKYDKDDFIITGVLDGGPAATAGIQLGDRLRLVGNEPFHSISSFHDQEGKPLTITLQRVGEPQTRTITVTPKKENLLRSFLDATRKSARVFVVEGKRIGYIHLWTMGHELFKQLVDQLVLGQLYNTEGLILDLRDGFGGNPSGFADVFFTPDVLWQQDSRGVQTTRRFGYGKPMVVLTNAGTRSAKEFLSYQFKRSSRATLVGTTTAGAFLGATSFPIVPGIMLELPIVGLTLDGIRLEAKGVAPDILVETLFPYTDKDDQILKAKQVLLSKILSSKRVLLH